MEKRFKVIHGDASAPGDKSSRGRKLEAYLSENDYYQATGRAFDEREYAEYLSIDSDYGERIFQSGFTPSFRYSMALNKAKDSRRNTFLEAMNIMFKLIILATALAGLFAIGGVYCIIAAVGVLSFFFGVLRVRPATS